MTPQSKILATPMLLLVYYYYYYYYYYYEQQSCELNIKVSGLDRFRRFSTAHSSDKQTHTHRRTYHATSVTIGRVSCFRARCGMRPDNNNPICNARALQSRTKSSAIAE